MQHHQTFTFVWGSSAGFDNGALTVKVSNDQICIKLVAGAPMKPFLAISKQAIPYFHDILISSYLHILLLNQLIHLSTILAFALCPPTLTASTSAIIHSLAPTCQNSRVTQVTSHPQQNTVTSPCYCINQISATIAILRLSFSDHSQKAEEHLPTGSSPMRRPKLGLDCAK